MSLNYYTTLTSAQAALRTGQSLILDPNQSFKITAKKSLGCRFKSLPARTAQHFAQEEAAWKTLSQQLAQNEDWKQAFHPSEAYQLQKRLVHYRAQLYKQTHGLWLLIVWLWKGSSHIRHCKRLLVEMNKISRTLNKSQEVVEEILKTSHPKRLDSFLLNFFPERIRHGSFKASDFTDPSLFYLTKRGCNWHMAYLDSKTNRVCYAAVRTPTQVQELHQRLTSFHFYRSAVAALPTNSSFRVELTPDSNRRPQSVGLERNLVLITPEGRAFYRDAANILQEYPLELSAHKETLERQWGNLIKTVEDARLYETRSRNFQNLQSDLTKLPDLKLVNRYEELPTDNTSFLESQGIKANCDLQTVLNKIIIFPDNQYKNLRVYFIDPKTCRLSFESLDLTSLTSSTALQEAIQQIQASHIKVYTDYMEKVRELQIKNNLTFTSAVKATGCCLTFKKEITYRINQRSPQSITVTRKVEGLNLELLEREVELLNAIQAKYDALPEHLRQANIQQIAANSAPPAPTSGMTQKLYARLTPTSQALQIEIFYPLMSLNPPVWQSLTFEHPDDLQKKLDKINQLVEVESNYRLVPEALKQTSQFTQSQVPAAAAGIQLQRDLSALWQNQHWTAADLRVGGAVSTPERLWEGLQGLIRGVEHKTARSGVPSNDQERMVYYRNLHSLLTHITEALQRSTDPYVVKETLLSLAIAGPFCGGRWMGEALQHYQMLSGDIQRIDEQSLKERILFWIDQHKSSSVLAMASESVGGSVGANGQSTHLYINLVHRLTERGVAKFAVANAAGYNDPYAGMARGGPYSTNEALEQGFKRRCCVSELAAKIGELLDQNVQAKPQVFGVQMMQLLLEAAEKFHTTESERAAYANDGIKRDGTLSDLLDNLGYYVWDEDFTNRELTLKGKILLLRHCGIIA